MAFLTVLLPGVSFYCVPLDTVRAVDTQKERQRDRRKGRGTEGKAEGEKQSRDGAREGNWKSGTILPVKKYDRPTGSVMKRESKENELCRSEDEEANDRPTGSVMKRESNGQKNETVIFRQVAVKSSYFGGVLSSNPRNLRDGYCYSCRVSNSGGIDHPPSSEGVAFIHSLGIKKVRLLHPNHNLPKALVNTNVEVNLGIPNEDLRDLALSFELARR
ncbi:hypothetical protein EJ110_NYTH06817 [Nymphaea thermarum]|nr:hypothetical protein EJ110_NYTH06817 [Nymphaea thermarum]